MKIRNYIIFFALAGALVALISNMLWSTYGVNQSHENDLVFLKMTLMFFPAYVGTMSMGKTGYWSFVFYGFMFYNVVLYSLLGIFAWLGVNKHKMYFLIDAVLISAIWYGIWVLL